MSSRGVKIVGQALRCFVGAIARTQKRLQACVCVCVCPGRFDRVTVCLASRGILLVLLFGQLLKPQASWNVRASETRMHSILKDSSPRGGVRSRGADGAFGARYRNIGRRRLFPSFIQRLTFFRPGLGRLVFQRPLRLALRIDGHPRPLYLLEAV